MSIFKIYGLIWQEVTGQIRNKRGRAIIDTKPALSFDFDHLFAEETQGRYEIGGQKKNFTEDQAQEVLAYIKSRDGIDLPAMIAVHPDGRYAGAVDADESDLRIIRQGPPNLDFWIYRFDKSDATGRDVWEPLFAVDPDGFYAGQTDLGINGHYVTVAPPSGGSFKWDDFLSEWVSWELPEHVVSTGLDMIEDEVQRLQGIFLTVAIGRAEIYDHKRREAEAILELADADITFDDFPFIVGEAKRMAITPAQLAVVVSKSYRLGYRAMAIIENHRATAREEMKKAVLPGERGVVIMRFKNDVERAFMEDPLIAAYSGARN